MTNLHDLIDALRAGKVWEPTFRRTLKQAFPGHHAWLLSVAQDAICFDMGDVERVPELAILPDLLHMPYPTMWLEGATRDGRLALLACDVGERVLHVAIVNKRLGLPWYVNCVVEMPLSQETDHGLFGSIVAMFDGGDSKASTIEYAADAANLMARFVMALNCVNTTRVEHPAPKFLNQKRAAKGNQPLFSYWTLHLPSTKAVDGPPLGGTHASPRLHLRRGHIRQHSPGKYTWVEACVVGSKQAGMVVKDYALGQS